MRKNGDEHMSNIEPTRGDGRAVVSKTIEAEVPDHVVDAIASRLDVVDQPDRETALDLAHECVETSFRFVTTDGEPVEDAALDRAGGEEWREVDVPLDDATLEAVDEAADRSGVDRLEWLRGAARDRLENEQSDDGDGIALTFDEDDATTTDDAESSSADTAEPIDVEAAAELDYVTDPRRPLSIELAIPGEVVDESELDDVLECVSIEARIDGEQ